MVLPIEASMAHRPHFDLVLSLTMIGIATLYIGFGVVRFPPAYGIRQRAEGMPPIKEILSYGLIRCRV